MCDGKFSQDIFRKYIQWKISLNVKKIGQNKNASWRLYTGFFSIVKLQLNIVLLKRLEILHCYFWKRRCINSTGRTFHLVSFSRRKGSWFFLLFLTSFGRFLHTYFLSLLSACRTSKVSKNRDYLNRECFSNLEICSSR